MSVSESVVAAHEVIKSAGLKYLLHPMGTCIEGTAEDLYALAAAIHRKLVQQGYQRIAVVIKIDDRRDREADMDTKLRSVQDKLAAT